MYVAFVGYKLSFVLHEISSKELKFQFQLQKVTICWQPNSPSLLVTAAKNCLVILIKSLHVCISRDCPDLNLS